jgi:hypothetical protein
VVVLVAPGEKDKIAELNKNLAKLKMENSRVVQSIHISVSNEECPGVDDASDLNHLKSVTEDALEESELLDHRVAYCIETGDAILSSVRKFAGNTENVLVVNCPEKHRLRREFENATFLNDISESPLDGRDRQQIVADIRGQEVVVPVGDKLIHRVVVAGKFSEGMRKWCKEERKIENIIHFTSDLNKIAWDAEKLKDAFRLEQVEAFETRPHSMDMFFVSRLVRS